MSDGLVRNRLDDVQFDDAFSQQPQRPTRMPRRHGATAQRDDLGFLFTIEDLGTQLFQNGQFLQTRIRHLGANNVQPLQLLQGGEFFQPLVSHLGLVKV